MTSELILPHYDFSSYSEKVRLVLGLKGLTWRSVEISPVLPKPDYSSLERCAAVAKPLQLNFNGFCAQHTWCTWTRGDTHADAR